MEESQLLFSSMYYRLFNRVTDALAALEQGDPRGAERILIQAQQEAEECFLCGEG